MIRFRYLRRTISRQAAKANRARATIAVVVAAAIAVAGVGIVPSLASGWTRTEYDNGPASSLNCSSGTPFTTTAWGQEIAGQVAGSPLDAAHLAGVAGIGVTSGSPHSTVTAGTGASGLSYLTNDAWSSDLAVGALNSVSLNAGVMLPLGASAGAETEYARATGTGVSTGASGALTSPAGGLVSLETPTSTTPGFGTVDLDTALSAIVGTDLTDATQLADASLTVGALGSTTSLDSCSAAWEGESAAVAVVRNYVLSKLGLAFDSSLIGTATSTAAGSINTLSKTTESTLTTTLNALQPLGDLTGAALGTVGSALGTLIPATAGGLPVSLGTSTIQVGVTFTPSSLTSALSSTLTSGPVSIDLATGEIDVDLSALTGSLDGLGPNTNLLSTGALSTLSTDIGTAVTTWATNLLEPAFSATLNSASVTVNISTDLALTASILGTQTVVPVANLAIGLTGTLASFLSPGGTNGNPHITVSLNPIALTGLVGTLLNTIVGTLLSGLTSTLSSGVLGTLVPALSSAVLSPLLGTATTTLNNTLASVTSSLAAIVTSLGSVVGVLGDALQLVVNAEPDQPNPVGAPDTPATGRFFESALEIGVLNQSNGTSPLSLYLGSSSAGPNLPN